MSSVPAPTVASADALSESLQIGLRLLGQAHDYARQLGRPARDFALEIEAFWQAGLTNTELRCLLCRGLVEHVTERPFQRDGRRRLARVQHLGLSRRSCFLLTEAGLALLRRADPSQPVPWRQKADRLDEPGWRQELPRWDGDLHELWLGPVLVKRFARPAPNQEVILAAFEEDHWPARIDDPLPGQDQRDPVQCLHDTIGRLNRHQLQPLIRFSGDGTGQGVRWEPVRVSRT